MIFCVQELLEQEEPLHPLLGAGEPYESLDYMTLMNLVTHTANRPEDTEMRNTVIAVYLLRFLQHGRYFSPQVQYILYSIALREKTYWKRPTHFCCRLSSTPFPVRFHRQTLLPLKEKKSKGRE